MESAQDNYKSGRSRSAYELTGLTGLRGIAALTVFIAHAEFDKLIPTLRQGCAFFQWHNQAVDLFFMLSGLLLTLVYSGKIGFGRLHSWRSYFVARLARIVPLYLITFAATLCVFLLASLFLNKSLHFITCSTVITNLLLIQNWPFFFHASINVPSWSLSVEAFCYLLLMPVALILDQRMKNLRAVCGLILLLMAGRILVPDSTMGWESLARGLTCFLTGSLLHRLMHSSFMMGHAALLASAGVIVFIALRSFSAWSDLSVVWVLLAFPPLIIGLSNPADTGVIRLFKSRVALWLGDISIPSICGKHQCC